MTNLQQMKAFFDEVRNSKPLTEKEIIISGHKITAKCFLDSKGSSILGSCYLDDHHATQAKIRKTIK